MQNSKSLGDMLSSKNREKMSNLGFYVMTGIMKLVDLISNYSAKNVKTLGLTAGQIVIDYGCGPARYIKNASEAVGEKGKVIAVDIHTVAIQAVNKIIAKYKLSNVETVFAKGYRTSIESNVADVVYLLDVFHMIENPKELLLELSRLVNSEGVVIIEDGHQSRTETIAKIQESDVLDIVSENKFHVKCKKRQF